MRELGRGLEVIGKSSKKDDLLLDCCVLGDDWGGAWPDPGGGERLVLDPPDGGGWLYILALLGGPEGGPAGVLEVVRGSCNMLALFLGFTTSIGRS